MWTGPNDAPLSTKQERLMNAKTPANREKIRISVATGLNHACLISDETLIPHAEVTRLLNLLAREPGSGIVKKTRGIYLWDAKVQKPTVEKEKTIMDWVYKAVAKVAFK